MDASPQKKSSGDKTIQVPHFFLRSPWVFRNKSRPKLGAFWFRTVLQQICCFFPYAPKLVSPVWFIALCSKYWSPKKIAISKGLGYLKAKVDCHHFDFNPWKILFWRLKHQWHGSPKKQKNGWFWRIDHTNLLQSTSIFHEHERYGESPPKHSQNDPQWPVPPSGTYSNTRTAHHRWQHNPGPNLSTTEKMCASSKIGKNQ